MRHLLAIAGVAAAALLAGCAATLPPPSDNLTVINVGETAADMERAIAHNLSVRSGIVTRSQTQMDRRRDQLQRDAYSYRDLAAAAYTDSGLRPMQRRAFAEEYLMWAEQREREAGRYRQMIQAYDVDICIIENQRHNRIRAAAEYDSQKAYILQ